MMPPGGADARADQFEALERIQHVAPDRSRARPLLDELEPWAASEDPDSRRRAADRRAQARPRQGRPRADRARGGDVSARRRTRSSPGSRRARRRDFKPFAPALEHLLELQQRYIACFDEHGRVRAPVRRPARRLRARPHHRGAARAVHAPSRRSSSRSSRRPPRRGRTAASSRATSRRTSRSRSRTSCLRAVGYDAEHWRLDPSVHPFARSRWRTPTCGSRRAGSRTTWRWRSTRACTSSGTACTRRRCRPRTTGRRSPMPPGSACTSPRAGCGRTSSAAGKPFCEWVLPVMQRHFGAPVRGAGRRRALSLRQPGPALADPDRGRRDDVQPAHRAAVRARARAGRGAARASPTSPTPGTRPRTACSGSETPSVNEGVLQDIHWGTGMIGYFPTYTIGNLMAAQLWQALRTDLPDIDSCIAAGDFAAAARVAARQHPPARPQARLARVAAPGDGGGAAGRAVPRLPRGQAAGRRVADRSGPRSPLLANICSRSPSGPAVEWEAVLCRARQNSIVVTGAREHNLKDVTVELPRDSLVVITGLSGSGKSSLAFDTIYAEGQRRYVESLSAYARQFLGQMDKPDVDSIEGLSPAISIDQKTTSRNPRSTVGTVTEIYDYLRLLWARVGKPHCFNCGRPIAAQSAEQIIDQIMGLEEGTRFMVMAPIVRGRKGEYGKQLAELRVRGLHAREGGRRAAPARGGDRPRQEVQARHLGGRGPSGHAAGAAQAPGRLGGDGGGAGRRHPRGRDRPARGRAGDPHVLRALRLPALRDLDARAGAALVLVQRAARRLPAAAPAWAR